MNRNLRENLEMSVVVIGNISLIDLKRKVDGLNIYKLATEHIDDDFPDFPVPEGFIVNGASVPKFLRDIISPTGEMFRASVPHDYFYASKIISRRKADKIFRKIIMDDTDNWFLAYGAWAAVRVCGGKYWKKAGGDIDQVYLKV